MSTTQASSLASASKANDDDDVVMNDAGLKRDLSSDFASGTTDWASFDNGVWTFSKLPPLTALARRSLQGNDLSKLTPLDPSEFPKLAEYLASFVSTIYEGDSPSPFDSRRFLADYVRTNWTSRNGKISREFFSRALALYATPALNLPKALSHLDRMKVPTSTIVELWLAMHDLFGDRSTLDVIFSQGDHPWPLSAFGTYLLPKVRSLDIPLSPDQTLQATHDTIRSLSYENALPHTDPTPWTSFLTRSLETVEHQRSTSQQNAADLALLLASTPPSQLPGFQDHSLRINQVTVVWKAANSVIGSLWAIPAQSISTPAAVALATGASPSHSQGSKHKTSAVAFSLPSPEAAKKSRTTSTPTKISTMKDSGNTALLAADCFFPISAEAVPARVKTTITKPAVVLPPRQTYLTVSLPIVVDSSVEYASKLQEVTTALLQLWRVLVESDQARSAILCFSNPSHPEHPPLRQPLQFPDKSSKIKSIYVEGDMKLNWAPNKQYTDLNFLLGHTNPIDKILEHKNVVARLIELQAFVTVDKLQCPRRFCVGNLLGPIVSEKSLESIIRQLLSSSPFRRHGITGLHLEIRRHMLASRLTKDEPRVNDIHVICDEDQRVIVRQLLRQVYPSQPQARSSYPSGIQYRFMDEVISKARIVSPHKLEVARNLRAKQKAFTANIVSQPYHHIKHLHLDHPSFPGVNLAQNLLSLHSQKFPDRFLFVAIEQDYMMLPTVFHYTREMEPEVNYVLPSIPLLCEQYFGLDVAKSWLHSSAWSMVEDEYGFELLEDDGGEIQGGRLFSKESDPDFQTAQYWHVDSTDPQVVSIPTGETEIYISNMDIALLHTTPPSYQLGDDGASTKTAATTPFGFLTGPLEDSSGELVRGQLARADGTPALSFDSQIPSVATTAAETTPLSSITAPGDNESSTMAQLLAKATWTDPTDFQKAQQYLTSRAAGRHS